MRSSNGLHAVTRHAVIFTIFAGGLCVAVFAASSAGVREVWAGALARGVAEAVAVVAPCWFQSARPQVALRPTDADAGQCSADFCRDCGGGHLASFPSGPQTGYINLVFRGKFVVAYGFTNGREDFIFRLCDGTS